MTSLAPRPGHSGPFHTGLFPIHSRIASSLLPLVFGCSDDVVGITLTKG